MTMRVTVLAKKSSYRALVQEQRDARVRELLSAGDPTVRRMHSAHDDHEATVEETVGALRELGIHPTLLVGARTSISAPADMVVTVGGDGTLLAASHQIGAGIALVGINSAPNHSVGFFCAGKKGSVLETLRAAVDGTLPPTKLARMRLDRNHHCLHKRILNEALFCHPSPAATSRYILEMVERNGTVSAAEEQKSSGIWVGPPAGSTAALRSAGGQILSLDANVFQFVVREPYTPPGRRLQLLHGLVRDDQTVVIRNKLRDARIFVDGHHTRFEAAMGDVLRLSISDEPLTVLGMHRRALSEL